MSLSFTLDQYVQARIREFDQIPPARQQQLRQLTRYIQTRKDGGQPIRLTFICTHNSRRSHMSQLWAAAAAIHYRVPKVETYSGGTEATAFNPRAVAAMQRAGFSIDPGPEPVNPRYQVHCGPGAAPQICFSKRFDAEPNPDADFCAVMTCTDADANCPVVPGAAERLALPFEDPKAFDGTPEEAQRYDERCAQIARELLFVFANVR
ncbi:MAG: protein-tyrosine-phosphatase [Pirellulaceae bacterium]